MAGVRISREKAWVGCQSGPLAIRAQNELELLNPGIENDRSVAPPTFPHAPHPPERLDQTNTTQKAL